MTYRARMIRIVLGSMFMALVGTAAALAGPAEDANAILDRWATAFNANDADAVVKLYAPDATLLGTISPSLAEGTEAIRAYFKGLPGSGTKVVFADRNVAMQGNAVVTTGFYEFTRILEGKPVPLPARFTIVVVNLGGAWLIGHHHSSQRPKPPQ